MKENPLKPGTFLPSIQPIDWTGKKYYNLPPCQAQILDFPNSRLQKYRPCRRKARCLVNGSQMCEIHAGRIALAALLEDPNVTPETPLVDKSEKGGAPD